MDLYELLMADEPTAQARAEALGKAMGLREQAGLLGQISGDRVLGGVGGTMMQSAATGNQRLGDVLRARQAQAIEQAKLAQDAQQNAARLAAQQQQDAIENAFRARDLDLRGQQVTQDQFGFGQDATGGGFIYNKKTGQAAPLTPQGAFPGAGTGLKPQQFESDVQSFGKDVEPLAKAAPDIALLERAVASGDVAGFGPVAGRVPNLLTGEQGIANRQAAGRLMAAIIQAVSGQAASEKEVARHLEANGLGRTATDEQVRLGVEKLKAQYAGLLKQREAKYLPQVVDTYRRRGGYTSAATLSPEDQAAKAWAESHPEDPMAAEILQLLKGGQ